MPEVRKKNKKKHENEAKSETLKINTAFALEAAISVHILIVAMINAA